MTKPDGLHPILSSRGPSLRDDLLASLPSETSRRRVLRTIEAAAFLGISVVHLRRLNRQGLVPAPVRLGERRLGWRLGDLTDWVDQRPCVR